MSSSTPGGETRLALAAGVATNLFWGLMPLAYQLLGRLGVGAPEIAAHRAIWCVPAAALLVLAARQGGQVIQVVSNPRVLRWLVVSGLLIGGNWMLFIYAANAGRMLETSLGYYINPLLNMAAGALLFRERLDRLGALAIGLAVVGVALQAMAIGHVPVVALVLAASFSAYSVVRKRVAAEAQTGLLVESAIISVAALGYAGWLAAHGAARFGTEPTATAWLVACGPLTAIPLALFAWSARRLPLTIIGFLQFIAPTITFTIGLAQGEPFTPLRAASFAVIWAGGGVFIFGAWRRTRSVAAGRAT